MASSFKKAGNEFQGEIVTLSVQTKGVRIVPETNRGADNAPSHRVFVGRAEISEFCGLRLAGDFRRRTRENGGNSARRPRHASLTDRNCEAFRRSGNRVGLPGLDGGAEGKRVGLLEGTATPGSTARVRGGARLEKRNSGPSPDGPRDDD